MSIDKTVSILSAILLVSVLAFGYGLAIGVYRAWPFHELVRMKTVVESYLKYGRVLEASIIISAPKHASRQRITIHNKNRASNGLRVFVGWNDELSQFSAWLYDQYGALKHQWEIDADPSIKTIGSPHAFKVLNDGSLIVSFGKGEIMTRLDACSKPIWIKKGFYHHSLEQAEDGSFWTWRGDRTAMSQYQYLENFDAQTGDTIKEIELVDDIIKASTENAIAFQNRPDHEFEKFGQSPYNISKDIYHPNDIDILYSDIEEKFPEFNAGDLLLSFRIPSLVAVLDPMSKVIKWTGYGPWRLQHDPDFTDDGMISVYNNNTDRSHSEIIKINPTTRKSTNELIDGDLNFYSGTMGKHQYLPNGNILITVPDEGRVIEVTSDGNKVYEFNNILPHSTDYNGHVANAQWVPNDYFKLMPSCPDSQIAESTENQEGGVVE